MATVERWMFVNMFVAENFAVVLVVKKLPTMSLFLSSGLDCVYFRRRICLLLGCVCCIRRLCFHFHRSYLLEYNVLRRRLAKG